MSLTQTKSNQTLNFNPLHFDLEARSNYKVLFLKVK